MRVPSPAARFLGGKRLLQLMCLQISDDCSADSVVLAMSSEDKSWVNWEDNLKWIGTALAILLVLLKSLITYLWDLWQDKRNPQPPSQPPSKAGQASPGAALNLAPVLLSSKLVLP